MTVPAHTPSPPSSDERFALLVDGVQDYAIFMLDPDGIVMTWNAGAQRLKGWSADEIIGRSFHTFYPPEAIDAGWPQEELRRATTEGRIEDQGWRVRRDGTRLWVNVIITALRGEDGTLRGFAKVTRDLTAARAREEALRQSEEQLRLLVESVADYAIFLLDPQGHVRTWNVGAVSIHGYSAAEALGMHFSQFFTEPDRAAGRPADELMRALRDGRAEDQGWRLRRDGGTFWADVVITPVKDAEGHLRGFAKVTRDLSAQRRITELEHDSRRMSEFLAMLAHELRNPLAPIRNAVSIIQMVPDLPPVMQRTRDIISRQVDHMTRLVDDLLDVGRIVTGKILLKQEPLDYRDVVQASVESAHPLIEAKRHRLGVTLPAQVLPVVGDATRLAQALQNLLNNAARYTPEGGDIALAVSVENGWAVTRVTDNGIGIAPEALRRIFDLFVQEASERSPSDSGLGIGLSLARTLVEQQGGRLGASSDGLGLGSTFTLHLPLRTPTAGASDVAAQVAVEPPPSAARRVLVVDDNRDSADSMVEVLRMLGHEPRAAYDAATALRLADELQPEIALLDLNMPDVDGFSLLRSLRSRPGEAQLFAAAMTGYGQVSDRAGTLAAGFDAHLTKPVDAKQLAALMRAQTNRPED